MLTSGREFSIEQLKINLVGGPLQSYNFLECKTFFFFFNTNQDKPSFPVHFPRDCFSLFTGSFPLVLSEIPNSPFLSWPMQAYLQGALCQHPAPSLTDCPLGFHNSFPTFISPPSIQGAPSHNVSPS